MIPEQDFHIEVWSRPTTEPTYRTKIVHIPTGLEIYEEGWTRDPRPAVKTKLLRQLEELIQHHYGPITEDPR